jgi:transcriptional regulator with XRE-family HTH domain
MQAKSVEYTIGTRLRRLLRLRRQSIREFSEATGIPYRTLQDYLAGKAKPGAEQLGRVALAGLDVNFLLTGKARRVGYRIKDTAPADDEAYYLLADMEVVEAIDRKAKDTISELLKEHLKAGNDLTFDMLLETYVQLFSSLADVFSRTDPPIEAARRAGMSVAQLIDSILDASAHIVAARLLTREVVKP